jgi:hypothetical protein
MASSGSQDEAADKAEEEEPGKDTEESKPASPGTAPGTLMKRPASAQAASLKKKQDCQEPWQVKTVSCQGKGQTWQVKVSKTEEGDENCGKTESLSWQERREPSKEVSCEKET